MRRQGTYLTIRKFRTDAYSLPDFIRLGSISAAAAEFLTLAVRLRRNILISGGTGTGKTSFLNALSGAIPETERIVVIEDSSELQLAQTHCLTLESRPAARRWHRSHRHPRSLQGLTANAARSNHRGRSPRW